MTLINDELREDIGEVTRQVWDNILSISVDAGPVAGDWSATVSSSVQILGEWNGAVLLTFTPSLASTIASTMFMMEADELSTDDVTDAVGEMANMIGGNIKSLLPGPSQLSMPTVAEGGHQPAFPGTEVVELLEFSVHGEPFNVTLMGERSSETSGSDTGED